MDRKERLAWCKKCNHKGFSLEEGIVCSLTGGKPTFEDECPYYSANINLEKYNRSDEDESLDELKNMFRLLRKGRFIVTPLIIIVCIVLFILTVGESAFLLVPDHLSLIKYGANVKPLTIDGQYWRLFTAVLLHANLNHLLMNMYAFFSIGFFLERLIGSWKMLLLFIVSSFAASAASLYWDPATTSVGASGAIYAMFGVYMILLTTKIMERKTRLVILLCIGVYVVYNIVTGLVPGIDYAAHIGGFATGLVLGVAMRPTFVNPQKTSRNLLLLSSGIAVPVILVLLLLSRPPEPADRFRKIMLEFELTENKALDIYYRYSQKYYNDFSRMTIGNVMPNFRKCRRLASEAGEVDGLPAELKEEAAYLVEYCEYSLRYFEMSVLNEAWRNSGHEELMNFYKRRTDQIVGIVNGYISTDTAVIHSPMCDFLSHVPEGVLVIYEGRPYSRQEAIGVLDPLKFNKLTHIPASHAEQMYGDIGKEGALLIMSREEAIRYAKQMEEGWQKDRYLEIYGLKRFP